MVREHQHGSHVAKIVVFGSEDPADMLDDLLTQLDGGGRIVVALEVAARKLYRASIVSGCTRPSVALRSAASRAHDATTWLCSAGMRPDR